MTMLLKGRDGTEFELAFTREMLPEVQDGFGDSAWATITYRAATGDEAWEESSPCLSLHEFHTLAAWLEAIGSGGEDAGLEVVGEMPVDRGIERVIREAAADAGEDDGLGDDGDEEGEDVDDAAGVPVVGEVDLLEPELRFSLVGEGAGEVTIRVSFHLEDRPEEFAVDAETDEATHIDLRVPRRQVLAAARSLRSRLDELGTGAKDDIDAEEEGGVMGGPDDDLNLIDAVVPDPPGVGDGEDNAGDR